MFFYRKRRRRSVDRMRTVFLKWRLLTVVCFFSGLVTFAGLLYVGKFLSLEFEREGDTAAGDAGAVPRFEHLQAPASDLEVKARMFRRAATELQRERNHSVSASASEVTGKAAPGVKELPSEQAEFRSATCEIAGAIGKQLDTNESSQMLRSMEYCNHMEDSGHNGQAEGRYESEYQLMAIAMVMRHGYRSPMYTLPNLAGPRLCCKLNNTLQWTATNQDEVLRRFIASANFILSSRTSTAMVFRRFGLYPNSDNCYGAQLTAHGSLQMLRLGQYFRSRYVGGSDALLAETEVDPTSKVYVRTTEYSRTFQSAAAFLFGLLSPTATEFSSLQIDVTKSLFLCSESPSWNLTCNCQAAGQLAKFVEGLGRTGGPEALTDRRLRLDLARVFNVSSNRLPHNGALLEVFMSHVCHGLTLPCPQSPTGNAMQRQCVTWTMVNDIWRRLDASGRQRLQSEDHRSLGRLLSFPLFHEIIQNFLAIARGERKRVFYLYSGHDKTITAAVDALGAGDGRWPPFGSRLVFELLRHRTGNRFFVRLLLDGRTVTDRLSSSGQSTGQSDGSKDADQSVSDPVTVAGELVSLEDFADFLLNRSFRTFGKSSYTDICG